MTGSNGCLPVPGSERQPLAGAQRVGNANPDAAVRVTVVLRRAAPRPGAPADPADVARVEEFAHAYGLTVTGVDLAARSVGLLGTVAAMNAAFRVDLGDYQVRSTTYRGRVGQVQVPVALSDAVVAVLGLDNRAQAIAHFRIAPSAITGYSPQDVAKRYEFPTGADGTGQTVAVIELGGGYRADDLATYFQEQGVTAPTVTAVSVDGAQNTPGGTADGEVMLDIEVIGAIAPGARIAVYFAPNTDSGFYDAVAAALHDTQRRPSVISISWGGPESSWTPQAMNAMDALFADAGPAGVTVYTASGDSGASDGTSGLSVDFPASSPNAVGCGGTTLTDSDEVTWNGLSSGGGATGGGVSVHFGLPGYQAAAAVPANPAGSPGRGVPDVAGNADPATGYRVRVDGQDVVVGGTSAVAPLWTALTALANQINGAPAGAPHDRLYGRPTAFRDVVSGDNGGYQAGAGWDPCTGLGSPRGTQIVQVMAT